MAWRAYCAAHNREERNGTVSELFFIPFIHVVGNRSAKEKKNEEEEEGVEGGGHK